MKPFNHQIIQAPSSFEHLYVNANKALNLDEEIKLFMQSDKNRMWLKKTPPNCSIMNIATDLNGSPDQDQE